MPSNSPEEVTVEMRQKLITTAQQLQNISEEMRKRLSMLAKELGVILQTQYEKNENTVTLGMNAAVTNAKNAAVDARVVEQINDLNQNLQRNNQEINKLNISQTLFGNKPANSKELRE